MRSAKPWYRKQKDTWCVYLNGSLVTLVNGKANKKAALQKFKLLLLHTGKTVNPRLTIAEVCDLFLEHSKKNHAAPTFEQNQYFLQSLVDAAGRLKVLDLQPFHVTRWVEKTTWGPTSQNRAIGAAKQCLNWAKQEGYVTFNPIADVKRPKAKHRERILTPAERKMVFTKIKGQGFRDYLTCLEETGARPGELARVTKDDVHLQKNVIILWKHKTGKKTGKPRLIFLTPTAKTICKKLCERHPEGPIFRTIDGNAWTKDSLNCRFRRLRKKYPELVGITAYSVRHSFATNALERGVPIAAVAELMGHSSTEMLERVYGHLSQKGDYLTDMAKKAAGG